MRTNTRKHQIQAVKYVQQTCQYGILQTYYYIVSQSTYATQLTRGGGAGVGRGQDHVVQADYDVVVCYGDPGGGKRALGQGADGGEGVAHRVEVVGVGADLVGVGGDLVGVGVLQAERHRLRHAETHHAQADHGDGGGLQLARHRIGGSSLSLIPSLYSHLVTILL